MAGIGGVVIQFTAKADQALRETKKLARNLDQVGDKTEGAGKKFGRMAKVGLLGVAAGAGAAAAELFQMGEEAADNARSADNLRRILENTTGATKEQTDAIEEWIGQLELATNVADNDLRDALGRLAVATDDTTKAQELLALAVDTSVARGEDLDTTVRAMEKALSGNTNALKRQMPWLDENADGTLTLDEAVRGLEEAYGGAAKEAAKHDPYDTLLTVWGNMREELGTALLPKMQELGEWLQSPEGQTAIAGWISATEDFATAMGNLGDQIGPVVNLLGDIKDAYDALPGFLKKNPISGALDQWDRRPWGPTRTNERAASNRGDEGPTASAGRVTNFNIYYPKPESASTTISRAIRTARNAGY
jgi:hypothetical protein